MVRVPKPSRLAFSLSTALMMALREFANEPRLSCNWMFDLQPRQIMTSPNLACP